MTKKSNATKNLLRENVACFILITCDDPTAEGKMNVELSYEGDVDLAAMMIDRAHGYIHKALEDSVSSL